MRLVLAADLWLHRVRHGRCYNRWLCERLSHYEARRAIQKWTRA